MSNNRPEHLSALAQPGAEPIREVSVVHAMARFLQVVRRRKGVLLLVLAASCLFGGLHYATATRVYESKASLLILQTGEDALSTGVSTGQVSRNLMATYQRVLGSEVVLKEARTLLAEQSPPGAATKISPGNLRVSESRGTNILEIAYRSQDPSTAAGVVGSVVTAYLAYMDGMHKSTGRDLLDVLTKQKVDLENELRAKESELAARRAEAGELVLCEGEQGINAATKRALKLNDALIAAHERRLETESELAAIESTIRAGGDLRQFAVTALDKPGSELLFQQLGLTTPDDNAASRIRQQLLEDTAGLQAAGQMYGPANRKVREIEERIRLAREYLESHRQQTTAGLSRVGNQPLAQVLLDLTRRQLQQAVSHENTVAAAYHQEKERVNRLDQTVVELDLLEHDLARLRGFYDVVLDRIKSVDFGQDTGALRATVISPPKIPTAPVAPRLEDVAIRFVLLGLLVGLALVYVLDVLDDHFRSPEELRQQLGLPVLAMIQRLKTLETEYGPEAVHVHVEPNATETEAFRTLRTALAFADGGAERLVVSSSEPGDGKTTVVSNLAAVYGQSGKRTLLIDADMRRPGLSSMLALRGRPGLSTILHESAPVEDVARQVVHASLLENVDVIASGPRSANPTELLSGPRFSELLAWAEAHYDQILVDSPPAMVSDTAIIGRLVDGVLLAVQPDKNRRRVVVRAVESFSALGINVLGIVANRLTPERSGDYYGYGYGYESDDEPLPESGYGVRVSGLPASIEAESNV